MRNAERILFALIGAAPGVVVLVFIGVLVVPYEPPLFLVPLLPLTGGVLGWIYAVQIDAWLRS